MHTVYCPLYNDIEAPNMKKSKTITGENINNSELFIAINHIPHEKLYGNQPTFPLIKLIFTQNNINNFYQ